MERKSELLPSRCQSKQMKGPEAAARKKTATVARLSIRCISSFHLHRIGVCPLDCCHTTVADVLKFECATSWRVLETWSQLCATAILIMDGPNVCRFFLLVKYWSSDLLEPSTVFGGGEIKTQDTFRSSLLLNRKTSKHLTGGQPLQQQLPRSGLEWLSFH